MWADGFTVLTVCERNLEDILNTDLAYLQTAMTKIFCNGMEGLYRLDALPLMFANQRASNMSSPSQDDIVETMK